MADVVLESLSKTFGEVIAVDNISMKIKDGEFVVILGPSGCGKTTLLKMIAGLIEPTDGDVYIDGELVTDFEPRDRDVAMVFQNYALYPRMSVFNNISFPLELRGCTKDEIKKKVTEVSNLLTLSPLLGRKPAELSGGERQRVALARAIVREPKVFLMDEPLSNLDAQLRANTRYQLKKLHTTLGATVIYVTHDQVEAMTMGQKIGVLKDGKLLQYNTPSHLYNNPYNIFVAGFLGTPSMNFIEVSIIEENLGEYTFDAGEFKLRFSDQSYISKYKHRSDINRVIYGFRPEDVPLGTQKLSSVKGIIDEVEYLGMQSILHVMIGSIKVKITQPGSLKFKRGQEIWLDLLSCKNHLFDKVSEKNIANL